MPQLLLASASPRRKQYLLELGFEFRVVPGDAVEKRNEGEAPEDYARRLARLKAAHASGHLPGAVVLAADTIVVVDGDVLEKPADEADFQRMMGLLSGRTHDVITAVVARIVGGQSFEQAVTSKVTFRSLTEEEIAWYWASGEPRDKAGGYGLQGRGGVFVAKIEGSHSNVVGLPLPETIAVLEAAGIKPPWADPRFKR